MAKPRPKPQPSQAPAEKDLTTQAFLREVDDAMHEEKLKNYWDQFKWPLIGAVLALFALVGGWTWWESHTQNVKEAQATQLHNYLQNPADPAPLAGLAAEGTDGYRLLAQFTQAAEATTPEAKLAAYQSVMTDNSLGQEWRDLAKLYAAMVVLAQDTAQAESWLTELDRDDVSFRATALELLAQLAQQQNQTARARGLYERVLQIPGLPAGLAQRVTEQLGLMGSPASTATNQSQS